MRKVLMWVLIILGVLVIAGVLAFPALKKQTKKASPEQVVEFAQGDMDLEVFYCRPSKKGRDVFGGLVPFGEVWRTGANEATTFETATDIKVNNEVLPAGKYTLWTVPGEQDWEIIFNEKMYGWGVSFSAQASIDREFDKLVVKVPASSTPSEVEMFTIAFQEGDSTRSNSMNLSWDKTMVSVPIGQ